VTIGQSGVGTQLTDGFVKPSDEETEQQRLKLLSHARGLAIIDLELSISIDELAIGLSLGLLGVPLIVAVVLLGIQAFVAAQLGLKLGTKVSEEAQAGAEKVAGGFLLLVAAALIVLKISGHQL
jgi:putative Mn2+ efflux pump MntP